MKAPCTLFTLATLLVPAIGFADSPSPEALAKYNQPAAFTITPEAVSTGIEPHTVTIGAMGNSLVNLPFEPSVFRTRLWAGADAPDRVVMDRRTFTNWDSWRGGIYEDCEVRVYRIINAEMKLVRRDRVAPGGAVGVSSAGAVGDDKQLLSPEATSARWVPANLMRTGVPYHFTLSAVAKDGKESPASASVSVVFPKTAKAPAENTLVPVPRRDKNTPASAPLPAPTNLSVTLDAETGVASFTWDAVQHSDLAGYRLTRHDDAPNGGQFHLDLVGKAASPEEQIRAGDLVFLSKPLYTVSRAKMVSNRGWDVPQINGVARYAFFPFDADGDPKRTWEFERHPADSPVTDGGQYCGKITLREGGAYNYSRATFSGTAQSWYEVLDPEKEYVAEVWLKQEGAAKPEVVFSADGPFKADIGRAVFTPDATWKKFTTTFRVPRLLADKNIGFLKLDFAGPGTFWIDNFRVYEKSTPYLDWTKTQYDLFKASGMAYIRTHAFIKTGTRTYTMEHYTNAGGSAPISGGNTLPQNLAFIRNTGALPWIQVEFHMNPEEWAGLAEYLAAPYDPAKDTPQSKPWAHKRHQQGQTKPWIDEFANMRFEIGNETWNWTFEPWVFETMTDGATGTKYDRGEVYGFFQEYVRKELSRSPYWDRLQPKLEFVVGGWIADGNRYGNNAAKRTPSSRLNTIAAYNGGWDMGEGPATTDDTSIWRVLLNTPQVMLTTARTMHGATAKLRESINPQAAWGTYEAGPGYALSGLNNQATMTAAQVQAQEEAMKGLAGGTATLDTFLTFGYYGAVSQNYFTYKLGGSHWISHTHPLAGARPHVPWLAVEFFNHHGVGDFLKVQTRSMPAWDIAAFKRRKAMKDAPLASCFATRRGDRVTLFLLSRKLNGIPDPQNDGFTPVTVELPFTKARKLTLWKLTGDPRAHNIDQLRVQWAKVDLPAYDAAGPFTLGPAVGADARGLPPGSVFAYVFEGVDLPAQLPTVAP